MTQPREGGLARCGELTVTRALRHGRATDTSLTLVTALNYNFRLRPGGGLG